MANENPKVVAGAGTLLPLPMERPTSSDKWTFEDDGKTLRFTVPTNPPTEMRMTAEQLDSFLAMLAWLRSAMKPEIAPRWPFNLLAQLVHNPMWTTEGDATSGNSLIHWRSTFFGWQHFSLPPEEAKSLATALLKQLERPVKMAARN
ncbi:MAG TPA: hypothetical protein VMU69_22760 [Bradyrhizobium sp.]|nr:hypothetical protein [Bradyrhizobium sp.]